VALGQRWEGDLIAQRLDGAREASAAQQMSPADTDQHQLLSRQDDTQAKLGHRLKAANQNSAAQAMAAGQLWLSPRREFQICTFPDGLAIGFIPDLPSSMLIASMADRIVIEQWALLTS
jgi:hypothetical protein